MSERPRLVLWDIDGTLVDSARLGYDAFMDAFARVTSGPPPGDVPFAGRTDLEIAHDMLAVSGVEPDGGLLDRFEEALVEAMAARRDALRERGRALPGAVGAGRAQRPLGRDAARAEAQLGQQTRRVAGDLVTVGVNPGVLHRAQRSRRNRRSSHSVTVER